MRLLLNPESWELSYTEVVSISWFDKSGQIKRRKQAQKIVTLFNYSREANFKPPVTVSGGGLAEVRQTM